MKTKENNYIKVMPGRRSTHFFPFDDTDPKQIETVLKVVRSVFPAQPRAIYRVNSRTRELCAVYKLGTVGQFKEDVS